MKNSIWYLSLIFLFISCNTEKKPIDNLISRVTQGTVKNIQTEIVESKDGEDYFEINNKGENLLIKGNNQVSIATGFNWYLKYVAGSHISWNNLTEQFPDKLPLVDKPIRQATNQHLRYYLNYCTFSYSMAFWDWTRWEKEIDWMAMHGINLSLSITGNEVVWYNLLKRIGYTGEEINEFISGPAFMAWWQMNNLEGWGGPNPDEWYKKQEILQKQIVSRMRELGIEPVLPGFAGMVPHNIGEKLGYEITDPGKWCAFNRPAFLRTDDPHFDEFADMYYEEMEKLYGKANYYAIDPFHEGGNTKDIDLNAAGQTIMAAMKRSNPNAVWVAQSWQANPRPAMIDSLKEHDLLVLDLYSEKMPQWGDKDSPWYRPEGFGKHDWLYCMLLNFGARVGLHGRMDKLINSYYDALSHPNGKTLKGVGATPEGIENNPVMYELLFELPWRSERFTKEDWIKTYIKGRYGKSTKEIDEAWSILSESSYNCPTNYPGEGTVESLFCARPQFNKKKVSTWGCSELYYNPEQTRLAAQKMLQTADDFKGNNNFEYDLVDILRQSIADKGNDLLAKTSKAYEAKNAKEFEVLADSFLVALKAQDELLNTRSEFKVGTWIEQAKSLSDNRDNKKRYEWNARTLITIWGTKESSEQGGLHDYSHREWNGILGDLYHNRWSVFFEKRLDDLHTGEQTPIDFFDMEEKWTRENKVYNKNPEGDVIQTAKTVYQKVFGNI